MDYQEKNQKITDLIFFPMLVDDSFGIEDSPEKIMERWEIFNALSEEEKDRMLSQDVPGTLKNIAERYSFSEKETATLSKLVRELFFKIFSSDTVGIELQKRISRLTDVQAEDIGKIIISKILAADVAQINKTTYNFLNLSLTDALSQYPDISRQLISSTQLKLRISPEPMRPSVKNWITDYHEQMGLGKHGTFDRGNYLFHSENARRLTAAERQKISAVLASLDEGTPLTVDPEKQQIVFGEQTTYNKQLTTDNRQNTINNIQDTKDNEQRTTFHVQNAASNKQFTPLNPRDSEVRSNLTGQATGNIQNTINNIQNSTYNRQHTTDNFQKPENSIRNTADNKQDTPYRIPQTDNRQQPKNNIQNTINNRQDTQYKMPQTTDSQKYEMENRQPKTINLRSEVGVASQVKQDVRPVAPITSVPQQAMPQMPRPVAPRPQIPSVQPQQARPAAPPFNLPQQKEEKLSQYFGVPLNAPQRDISQQATVQSPIPKREFENKSPNFSDLLRTQQSSNSPKAPASPTQAAAPAGGTVSFSSPQQLAVERNTPVKRSPYRITPHDDIRQ